MRYHNSKYGPTTRVIVCAFSITLASRAFINFTYRIKGTTWLTKLTRRDVFQTWPADRTEAASSKSCDVRGRCRVWSPPRGRFTNMARGAHRGPLVEVWRRRGPLPLVEPPGSTGLTSPAISGLTS